MQLKQVFYWGVAALLLVWLADSHAGAAIGFVVLLIIGVAITHWDEYHTILKTAEGRSL